MTSPGKGTVLITGGARRIGAALAHGFSQAGYTIALHYRSSQEAAEALAKDLPQCTLYQADLTDHGAAQALIERVKADHPQLSMLINNASTFRRLPLPNTTDASLQEDIAINLLAPLHLMREFASKTVQGSIINMLDTAIHGHYPAYFGYLIAKKALAEATLMAAREYGPQIRINGICPGRVLPTEGDSSHDPSPRSHLATPLVDDIVRAALMLAESTAYYGQLLTIDGGESLQ